jgi:hypothetical protein
MTRLRQNRRREKPLNDGLYFATASDCVERPGDLAAPSLGMSPIAADMPNNRPRPEEPAQPDGGDLMAIYRACVKAVMTPQYICRACRKPILENTRVSDGVDAWHVGCVR